jgi:hypothetical protein
MDGFGIYNYASGDVFEGNYLAGQMCGRGEDSSALRVVSSVMYNVIQLQPHHLPILQVCTSVLAVISTRGRCWATEGTGRERSFSATAPCTKETSEVV